MKNPDNNPLRIVSPDFSCGANPYYNKAVVQNHREYCNMLGQLAIAESNLVKAGKNSALPHFIAIVKELEEQFGFKFEQMEDDGLQNIIKEKVDSIMADRSSCIEGFLKGVNANPKTHQLVEKYNPGEYTYTWTVEERND